MRAGVEQIAASVFLQGLPVPAAGETTEGDRDLDDAAEDAGINDLEHLLKLGRVARLLEGQEQAIGLAGSGDHGVEFGHAPSEGFFADGVVAGVERIDGGLRMEVAGQGVDH